MMHKILYSEMLIAEGNWCEYHGVELTGKKWNDDFMHWLGYSDFNWDGTHAQTGLPATARQRAMIDMLLSTHWRTLFKVREIQHKEVIRKKLYAKRRSVKRRLYEGI